MTGRDLIIFILAHGLEDHVIFTEEELDETFMTLDEAAVKFEVGTATVRVWVEEGTIPSITINKTTYILRNTPNPMTLMEGGK